MVRHKIPDLPPGRTDPSESAKRKSSEKETPHSAIQDFGMKAGVLALMGALAFIPWEKREREREERKDDERRRDDGGRDRRREDIGRRNDGRRGYDGRDGGRSSSAHSRHDHDRIQKWRQEVPVLEVEPARRRRRRSIPERDMRFAVAEGYEYILPDKGYLKDAAYREGVDIERRPKRYRAQEYDYRDRRSNR